MKEDRRKSVRVPSPNGLAILRTGGTPPITCKLINLSEGGCRIAIDSQDAHLWDKINRPNQSLELLLSSNPHLERFVVSADLRNVRPASQVGAMKWACNSALWNPNAAAHCAWLY